VRTPVFPAEKDTSFEELTEINGSLAPT